MKEIIKQLDKIMKQKYIKYLFNFPVKKGEFFYTVQTRTHIFNARGREVPQYSIIRDNKRKPRKKIFKI